MAAKIPHYARMFIQSAKPHLATFVKYAKVELTPPSPKDLGEVSRGIQNIISSGKTGKWKQFTVREAWLNILVATEVTLWFFIGECIGRRHFIGYQVIV